MIGPGSLMLNPAGFGAPRDREALPSPLLRPPVGRFAARRLILRGCQRSAASAGVWDCLLCLLKILEKDQHTSSETCRVSYRRSPQQRLPGELTWLQAGSHVAGPHTESSLPGRRVLTASASLHVSLSLTADCKCGTAGVVGGRRSALGPSGAAGRRRGERG